MPSQDTPSRIVLTVNAFRFRALSLGSGDLVLLLHGFPQFADIWSDVMPAIAAAGFRAVAVDQRGYSPEARPSEVNAYTIKELCLDVLGFADASGAATFHLVGHDWGGLLAWQLAAEHPDRVRSLTVLSTPHTDALFDAIQHDKEQKQRSRYIDFFRMPGGAAESYIAADNWEFLRQVYQGKVREERVEENIRRFQEPGALTAALNWYRALDRHTRIGGVSVPTLYVWGSEDLAISAKAAESTASYVSGIFHFERIDGKSHWLLEEAPEWIATRVVKHLEDAQHSAHEPAESA